MSETKTYDLVVIGSGAGGATLAQRLAASGKSILILERGEHLPVEAQNWDPKEVFIKERYKADEHWTDRKGKKFQPNIHYWVGGNTIFYGAALYRFRKRDFEQTQHYDGMVSPAWPISYDDLAAYYTEAETLWQVHGKRGSDPTDDADAPPYAYPPMKHDPEIQRVRTSLLAQGLQPFEMPIAVERNAANLQDSPCIRCRTCGGFPCLREAKSDGRKMVNRALDHANVELVTGAKVTALKTTANGKEISSIVYQSKDGPCEVRGDVVVLAAGAINSAALLLASKNDKHPQGLANGSDQVGRNYMFHTASASLSFALPKIHTDFPKTMAINDYYWGDPDGEFDFPMGHIQLLEYLDGDVLRGQLGGALPYWLIPKFLADAVGERLIPFLVMTEDLPEARNRVMLNDDGSIRLEYWHNNLVAHKRLLKRFHKVMHKAGRYCHCLEGHRAQIDGILPLYGTAHQCGTLRMGADAASSVVDANCKAHEIENLYVVDTSVFVSSAAVNPALTAIANSLRVADIIADQEF
ncbi:Glucose-methanol-choline (GMC) oxidoreductase:NAD binding site [hydrothermal vent metagenome]|uniref:Glucose-methanol-choline (GMC) oxidoreductase:NAD binding site n=1 Tax=hydrothermal vent metagenome TaxID=652676 RepID=A0A3B0S0V1_9ZZZZ